MFGMILSDRKIKMFNMSASKSLYLLVIGLVVNLVESYVAYYGGILPFIKVSQISFGNLIYCFTFIVFILNYNWKESKLISRLGDNSFGIYLVHVLFIMVIGRIPFEAATVLEYALYQVLTLAIVIISSTVFISITKKLLPRKYWVLLGL